MNANYYVKQKLGSFFNFRFLLGVILFVSSIQCVLSLFYPRYSVICFAVPLLYVYSKYTDEQMPSYADSILWHLTGGVAILFLQLFTNSLEFCWLSIGYLLIYSVLTYRNTFKAAKLNMAKSTISIVVVYSYFIGSFAVVKCLQFLAESVNYVPVIEFGYINFSLSLISIVFVLLAASGVNQDTVKNSSENNMVNGQQSIPTPARKSVVLSTNATGIIDFFESNQAVLNPNFSIEDLAHYVNMSKNEVSEVINQELAINFYQLIAKYRIDHAKVLLKTNENLTIEAIVEESGFNSKSTFNKYFKLFVGQTPSDYRNDYVAM